MAGCMQKSYETTVFESGTEGYNTFRIPAIVRAQDGTLLAFAEGRRDSPGDAGNIDLVMRRSDDDGRTWGPLETVWDDGSNTCGNPAPVFDESTGRLLLMMTWNLGSDKEKMINTCTSVDTRRVFLTYSDDLGRTWSTPKELTSELKDTSWTWYATGPCHAIQKKHDPHKGRIIVPCNHNDKSFDIARSGRSYSHVVYSDDGGTTWSLGGNAEPGGNESTVAELSDGTLILNMRNWRSKPDVTLRRLSLSHDGGESWSETFYADSLYEPRCQGSMLSCTDRRTGKEFLLFSNPHSKKERKNMTISRSVDRGTTWTPVLCVNPGPSAYSDMVELRNGRFGLLYETGDESNHHARISFRYFGLY